MSTGIISITIDSTKVENMLNGYQRTIPEGGERAVKKIASMYAEFYLNQLPLAKGIGTSSPKGILPFTGEAESVLRSQIGNPIKLGKGEYGVIVLHYLVMLDSMRTHYVSLKRGRLITAWAREKAPWAFGTLSAKLGKPTIIVHRHPWIRSANIKAGKNVAKIAKAEIDRAIRNKGR